MSLDVYGLRGAGTPTAGSTWRVELRGDGRLFRGWVLHGLEEPSLFEGPRCLECGSSVDLGIVTDLLRHRVGGVPLRHACRDLGLGAELRHALDVDARGERNAESYERILAWQRQQATEPPVEADGDEEEDEGDHDADRCQDPACDDFGHGREDDFGPNDDGEEPAVLGREPGAGAEVAA